MAFSQDDRPLKVKTPLGKDVVLLQGFSGEEAVSQLFQFRLELLAENQTDVPFDKLLGQKVTVSIKLAEGERHISGICNRVSQGGRDATITRYYMEIVPQFWLLTRRVQCRIFQQETVPDILKKVLEGLDVTFEIRGDFPKRDYCVQYRESDFAFASRLMEAEGIYYFFKHTADGHQLVVANTPQSHTDVAPAKAIYEELEGGNRKDDRIHGWRKLQELRSGKVTLWDTYFEMPQKHLEAEKAIQDSVAVGKVTHKLKVAGNDKLELYDYPGGYAEWFDGVAPGGGDNASALGKLFQENQRVVGIRMQEEAVHSLTIDGDSTCGQFAAGHKFTLERHFNADGAYVLTRVSHVGSLPAYRSGQTDVALTYDNTFKCIPAALPFRPERVTEEPLIHGTQTAIVVGPPGEAIHCDKYARVKVQFLWDRAWKKSGESSCWVRVAQAWGGGNWGGLTLPHVGQEVVVGFEEGDPDRPVIVGRVYNAEQMPPVGLPAGKTQSILRDHGDNCIKMEGVGGKQQLMMYSPEGGTSIVMGAPPPAQIPLAVDAGGSGSGAGDPVTQCCPACPGEKPPPPNPPKGFWATTGGFFSVSVASDWLSFVGGDGHEQIVGTSTTFVQGSYVQHVVGDVRVRTLGMSTTTIIGMENTITVGVKNEVLCALNNRLIKGGLVEINSAKELFKSPSITHTVGKMQEKVGNVMQKYADHKHKVAGKLLEEAANTEKKWGSATFKVKGLQNTSADEMRAKAASIINKADKWMLKGASNKMSGKLKVDGVTNILGNLKVS